MRGGGRIWHTENSNPTFTFDGGEIEWRDSLVYSHVYMYQMQRGGSD